MKRITSIRVAALTAVIVAGSVAPVLAADRTVMMEYFTATW